MPKWACFATGLGTGVVGLYLWAAWFFRDSFR